MPHDRCTAPLSPSGLGAATASLTHRPPTRKLLMHGAAIHVGLPHVAAIIRGERLLARLRHLLPWPRWRARAGRAASWHILCDHERLLQKGGVGHHQAPLALAQGGVPAGVRREGSGGMKCKVVGGGYLQARFESKRIKAGLHGTRHGSAVANEAAGAG